jgi:large subunit ribosomal protein L9
MSTIQLILKEKIDGLGVEADVVNVKRGFATNFLLPSGKAYPATKSNLRHLEALQRKRSEREAKELQGATDLASKIKRARITLELATGSAGKAFGSVTNMDIAQALGAKGIEIDRHAIDLKKPIKNTGDFDVSIKIHPEVEATLQFKVKAKGDETKADDPRASDKAPDSGANPSA